MAIPAHSEKLPKWHFFTHGCHEGHSMFVDHAYTPLFFEWKMVVEGDAFNPLDFNQYALTSV